MARRATPILAALLLAGPLWAQAAGPASLLPAPEALSPLRPDGPAIEHDADSLWEKIDGEAEQYRRFGVRSAAFAYYTLPDDAMRGVEIAVFDMGTPLGAFGIYAVYRSPSVPALEAGNDGSFTDRQAMLWHGRHFVLIDGFGPDGSRGDDLRRAVETVAVRLGPVPPRPAALAAFEEVAARGSVLFLPDHLLGRETLPAGFEGKGPEGVRIFAALPRPGLSARSYRALLSAVSPIRIGGMNGFSGTDPVHGPLTLVAGDGIIVGVLAPVEHPATVPLLTRLVAAARR